MRFSGDETLSVEAILSQLYFIYVTSGILMSVVVALGIVGNGITLAVLCRKTLRSSPVCLLQCLTIHALVNMFYAIYSDIEPAIRTYSEAKKFIDIFGQTKLSLCDLELHCNTSLSRLLDLLANENNIRNVSTGIDVTAYTGIGSDKRYGNSAALTDSEKITTNSMNNLKNLSLLSSLWSDPPADNTSLSNVSYAEINVYLRKTIERFFAYSIIYFGLLVTLYLAVERCVAVFWPLRAPVLLTIRRTRLAIVFIVFVCVIVHLPQLIQELIFVLQNQSGLVLESEELLIGKRQRGYYRFYAISSLSFCLVLFVLNMSLLWKLTMLHKQYRKEFHHTNISRAGRNREINVTVLIVVLIFFQLPLYVFMNVIVFISQDNFMKRFTLMTKFTTVIRLLYITQSAFNFVIYCFFARNFRKLLKETCDSVVSSNAFNIHISKINGTKRKSNLKHACVKKVSADGAGSGSGSADMQESDNNDSNTRICICDNSTNEKVLSEGAGEENLIESTI